MTSGTDLVPELSVALIQDAIRGDRRAVRDLVDQLAPLVHYRVARTLMRQRRQAGAYDLRQETEDLIQNVFLFLFSDQASALQHWHPGRGTSLANYIGLLAERRVISILRSARHAPWTEQPTCEDEIEEHLGDEPPVDARVGSREMLGLVLDRIEARLSDRNLDLFHLLVIEERAVEEICTLLEMTPEAVYCARSRLARLARSVAAELAGETVPNPRRA